jgi:ribonuclease-3
LLALADPTPPPSDGPSPDDAELSIGRLRHRFADPSLLELALRHRSWCAENGSVDSNERLEFLGDSVLGLVVTDHLYRSQPDLPEGVLAQRRSELVNARTLAEVAREIDLGPHVRLGRGEALAGGADKTSILSDALEAVLGAIYLDAGLEVAARVILELLADEIAEVAAGRKGDHKSRLQEVVAQWDELPAYRVRGEGPDHQRWFVASVLVGGRELGSGEGATKKQAEQAAAAAALGSIADGAGPTSPATGATNGATDG